MRGDSSLRAAAVKLIATTMIWLRHWRWPETYPQRPATVSVHETHISEVFVASDRACELERCDAVGYGQRSSHARTG